MSFQVVGGIVKEAACEGVEEKMSSYRDSLV
jgi:hypothetical protein